MSEDNPWRQLGTIVNAVLLDARSKAIRQGAFSAPELRSAARKIAQPASALFSQPAGGVLKTHAGNGFLSEAAPAAEPPVQLELPFGIAAVAEARLVSRPARGTRLM